MNSDSEVVNDPENPPAGSQPPADEANTTPEQSPPESSRPSAIERQFAAMQSATTRHITYKDAVEPDSSTASFEDSSSGSRFGGRTFFAVLLIAAGLIGAYTFHSGDKEPAAPAEPALAQITNTLQKSPSAAPANANEPAKAMAAPSRNPMSAATPTPQNGITIPISDVSLRVRPELLRQLVAIYRLRLASDPHNADATATFSRLREHALAELDVISATDSPALAANSLELAARLFPELADNPRYRSIAARINTNAKNIAQNPAPATSPLVAAVSQTKPQTAPAATPPTRKPQVRVISLTPGIVKNDRFVPKNGGNIFRLKIGYRYRDERLDNQPGSGLIAQLSKSGSSTVLAEVPVEVTGSKGERSFLIGTFEKAQMGKFYKLNFIVDGHVLPSHTVQPMPAGLAGL